MTDLPVDNLLAAGGPRHAWFFACCLGLALIVLSVYVGLVLVLPWMPIYRC